MRVTDSQAGYLALSFTNTPSPPRNVPWWTLASISMAAITFPRIQGLLDLSRHFLVFPCHLLGFQSEVGEDVMEAGEVQMELGFQVQLP